MKAPHLVGLTGVFSLVAGLLATPPVNGCAPVWPLNKPVAIADETAVILWDSAKKTQHFIRRASFRTSADDFGFLVPTPTQPLLAEAGDEVFPLLAKITAPAVVEKPHPPSPGCGIGCSVAPMDNVSASRVEVLEEKHVGGYDAAVLAANDGQALNRWLKEHGYDFSPELADWAEVYARQGWVVTAFKVTKAEPGTPRAATSAVRMSFTTDHPFFPYREPARRPGTGETRWKPTPPPEDSGDPRILRIYFLSDERVQGGLRDGKVESAWRGRTVWANRIDEANRTPIMKALGLPENTGPTVLWLTEFEDAGPRQVTGDLFFSRSGSQDTIAREPYTRYVSGGAPDCVMSYALVACLFAPLVIRWFRQAKATT